MGTAIKMLEIRHVEDQHGSQRAYDQIYHTRAIRHRDSFYRWILHLVQPEPGKRLLDVACGQGVIPHMAAETGVEAHGFDLSIRAVREGGGSKAGLLVANGEHLPYADGRFDYITNIGSLEHYVDPEVGAHEMARVLRPNGVACILLPNTFSLCNMLYAWRNGRTADDGQPIQRYATQFEWRNLLEANGLVVTSTVKFERVWPTSRVDVAWYLSRPKNIFWLLLTPFLPLNLANSFVYLCHRAPGLA
jgi:SAM-dependent methyltransferase